jgi:hypothetical protein
MITGWTIVMNESMMNMWWTTYAHWPRMYTHLCVEEQCSVKHDEDRTVSSRIYILQTYRTSHVFIAIGQYRSMSIVRRRGSFVVSVLCIIELSSIRVRISRHVLINVELRTILVFNKIELTRIHCKWFYFSRIENNRWERERERFFVNMSRISSILS